MELIQTQVVGEKYQLLSKVIFQNRYGLSNLQNLKNWEQPLVFREGTDILMQRKAGPCGLFATLQAHLMVDRMRNMEFNREESLIESVLNIFTRISAFFVFCTDIDTSNNIFTFLVTDVREYAKKYMVQSKYLKAYSACLLLKASFVFASCNMENPESLPREPYIEFDGTTTVALVWLMLNGSTSDHALAVTESAGGQGASQTDIGIKVLQAPDQRLVGTWLNPTADVFVCLKNGHFFAVQPGPEGLFVCDSLGVARPDNINWI